MKALFGILFFLVILVATEAEGQQVLEVVTFSKVKTKKYNLGAELTYELRDEPGRWYTGTLDGFDLDNNQVMIGLNTVAVDNIAAFRQKAILPSIVSKFMMLSGLSSIIAIVFTPGIPTAQFVNWIYINAGLIVAGFTMDRLWRYKKVRFGEKRMLRLLDLTFYPTNDMRFKQ